MKSSGSQERGENLESELESVGDVSDLMLTATHRDKKVMRAVQNSHPCLYFFFSLLVNFMHGRVGQLSLTSNFPYVSTCSCSVPHFSCRLT